MKYSSSLGGVLNHLVHKHSSSPNRTRDLMAPYWTLLQAFVSIENVIANKDPMATDKAHAARINLSNDRLKRIVERELSRAEVVRDTIIAQIQDEISQKTKLVSNHLAPEIRSRLLSMNSTDRLKAVNKAIENNDSLTLSAISEGNEVLTGFEDTQREALLDAYRRKAEPELFKELEDVKAIADSFETLNETVHKGVNSHVDPAFIKQISEEAEKAKEAEEEFEAATA